ncbi:hypothetical protein F5I97DRAFT_1952045 [Phlebopus sp. FC_14]|nr:hypothetical protein F5I97DRAFT_1952045 [Phlebopus sp. FC_14]
MEDDTDRLLTILQAHGQQFLSQFDFATGPTDRSNGRRELEPPQLATQHFGAEEDWKGFESSDNRQDTTSSLESDRGDNDGLSSNVLSALRLILNGPEFEQNDDGFTTSSSRPADVVVFSDSRQKSSESIVHSKALKKLFMSSKVSKVTLGSVHEMSARQSPDDEIEDERTNAQNDALLHRLVHTKLLSASLNPELNLTHAQRGKALSGRVLELNGSAKFGKGETSVREVERNKASKRVREGLLRKKAEREQKQLEEAKNLGNYHRTLKRLYEPGSTSTHRTKRERGLGIGVGKFSGGTLKLTQEEVNQALRPGGRGHWQGRGRARRHGKT